MKVLSPKATSVVLLTIICLMGLSNLYILWYLGGMMEETLQIVKTALPAVFHSSDMNTNISDYRIREWRHLLADSKEQMQRERAAMQEELAKAALHLQELQLHVSTIEERALTDDIQRLHKEYLAISQKALALSEDYHKQDAKRLMFGDSKHIYDEVSASLDALVRTTTQNATARAEHHEHLLDLTRVILLFVVIGAIILSIVITVLFLKSSFVTPRSQANAPAAAAASASTSSVV